MEAVERVGSVLEGQTGANMSQYNNFDLWAIVKATDF